MSSVRVVVDARNDKELGQLVDEGRANGEPVEGKSALKPLRENYVAPSEQGEQQVAIQQAI